MFTSWTHLLNLENPVIETMLKFPAKKIGLTGTWRVTPIDWTRRNKSKQPTHSYKHTQHRTQTTETKAVLFLPTHEEMFFLLWGGLSGVVHWSQPSVINCHNASKLTNGLSVKEGPLIYWSPLVDPEPIISITAGFHVWASFPANPWFLCLTLQRFQGMAHVSRRTFHIQHMKVHASRMLPDRRTHSFNFPHLHK